MSAAHRPISFTALPIVCLCALLTSSPEGVAAVQTGASGLLSHRAVYSLSRHSAAPDSDVTGVTGRLELTFEVACDGWRIEQFIGFRLYHLEGVGIEHVAQLSGWESVNGVDFWFNTRSYQDRELLEELGGVARLVKPGGSGKTHYAKPKKETKPLPEGTIFPARHLVDLIRAAEAGKRHLARTVFDGSTMDSPYEITAFIGEQNAAGTESTSSPLTDKRSWAFRLAYFKVDTIQPTPEFEMSATLYENGIAGDMIYDYGDFSVDVTLQELEALPTQDCGG